LEEHEIALAHIQKSFKELSDEVNEMKTILSETQNIIIQMAINQRNLTKRLNQWPVIEIDYEA
jgi:septal ring factor EnvC (AmiA/AmiB activator)